MMILIEVSLNECGMLSIIECLRHHSEAMRNILWVRAPVNDVITSPAVGSRS